MKENGPIHQAIEKITPKLAAEYLARNTSNRRMRSAYVEQLAKEFVEGRYRFTHQGIAFDTDGALLDGQHRLQAIVDSGVTVLMSVTRGLPKEAQMVVDDHARRSSADALTLAGFPATQDSCAVAMAMFTHAAGKAKSNWNVRLSKPQLAEFMTRHRDAIDFTIEALFHRGKVRGITTAIVGAVVAKAYYYADRQRLREFCVSLATGVMDGRDDIAAISMRNFLMSSSALQSGWSGRQTLYEKVLRACKAFLDREQWTKCYAASCEYFPLPE